MKVVVISGYFNPIHTGHLDYIKAASKLGDKLVVIVNNDEQVKLKGSVPFQDEEERKNEEPDSFACEIQMKTSC